MDHSSRKVSGIVFDLDGTLVDSVDTIWRASDHVLRANDYRGLERKFVIELMGKTIYDLFLKAEPGLSQEQQLKLFEDYKKEYMKFIGHTRLLPSVRETLKIIRAMGIKTAIVTTKSRENAEKILSYFNLRGYFDVVIGFEDVNEHKPSREPVLKAVNAIGLTPSEVIVVGDTDVDIRAGREAGAVTVAVKTGVTPIEKIIAEMPDYLIEDISGLLWILERHRSRGTR